MPRLVDLSEKDSLAVPRAKIVGYLLSAEHPIGRGKAEFFKHHGFLAEAWEVLADCLRRHATDHEVAAVEESPFGKRYVIEGSLVTPDGRTPLVRSVWFAEDGEQSPRFLTAYPLPRT
jgi:hypothetical protein